MIEFHNLKTLMLSDFMDIMCNNNLALVVKSGEPTQEAILAAWEDLIGEYYSMLGESNYNGFIRKAGRIEGKRARIYCIVNTVNVLLGLTEIQTYSPELLQDLRNWGYDVQFTDDEDKYIEDLEKVFTKLKREERELRLWINEIQEETKGKTNVMTEAYFGDTIAAIADIAKVVLEPTKTSVWSYVFLVKRLNKQAKQQRHG